MSFDTFDKFVGTPIWDVSSPDMMRKYSWTRLAWWNQRKVAVYLAALDIRNPLGETYLSVLVLTPGTCVWADSVSFSELLTYFGAIVASCIEVDPFFFTEYATYAMACFIEDALEEHGDTAGSLIDCLNVTDPASDEDACDSVSIYQDLQSHFKEPPLSCRYVSYYRMRSNIADVDAVDSLKRLTWGDLPKKAEVFLANVPALDNIIRDYNETFIKNAEKASEKPVKKPKRTTNVRELLWNSYPHICGLCGEQINSIDEMHVDHIIPLSRGGKDILANLQLTHARCNMDKGNTLFEESEE
jgi:hypothetical protein